MGRAAKSTNAVRTQNARGERFKLVKRGDVSVPDRPFKQQATEANPEGTAPGREELAWAAGLFEGEGCFASWRKQRKGRPEGQYHRMARASITMADEDILQAFQRIIRVGAIYLTKRADPKRIHHKQLWTWTTGSLQGVQHTAASLWAWLGPRRRLQASEALQTMARQRPTLAEEWFGKRKSDLTRAELREYHRRTHSPDHQRRYRPWKVRNGRV